MCVSHRALSGCTGNALMSRFHQLLAGKAGHAAAAGRVTGAVTCFLWCLCLCRLCLWWCFLW